MSHPPNNRDEPKLTPTAGQLAVVPDNEDFDRLLVPTSRFASAVHWTPTEVIHQVCRLLALAPGAQVLDVGSGVGKVCVLGSLISHGSFVGVEQRSELVSQARRLAAHLGSSAQFIHADAFDVDWGAFQALYFYNPFVEAKFDPELRIDDTIRLGDDVFNQFVGLTQARLATLGPGTRVVTFNGFGGAMPNSYELHAAELAADNRLQLWIQGAERATTTPLPLGSAK